MDGRGGRSDGLDGEEGQCHEGDKETDGGADQASSEPQKAWRDERGGAVRVAGTDRSQLERANQASSSLERSFERRGM